MAWSPNSTDARSDIPYIVLAAGAIACGYAAREQRIGIVGVISTWVVADLLQSILVIAFRLSHSLALRFLGGGVAKILINPRSLAILHTTGGNNVLSPAKSGGLFLNANAGSVMAGVAAVLAVYLALQSRKTRWWLIALVDVGAVVASGSRTGQLLLLGSLVLCGGLVVNRSVTRVAIPATVVAVVTYLVLTAHAPAVASDPLLVREFLWSQARTAIASHAMFGLGYGGWNLRESIYFALLGSASFPPHNLVLNTWLISGVVGAGLLLMFFWRTWSTLTAGEDRLIANAVAIAFVWTVLHSMGDNTSVFGDAHTGVMLGLLVGYVGGAGRLVATVPQVVTSRVRIRASYALAAR